MRKYLFVLIAVAAVLIGNMSFADTYTRSATLQNGGYNNALSKASSNKLVEMENALYGTVYNDQNLLSRVERLENTVFNRYYPDYAMDQRLNNLIYSYNRRYANPGLARRIANKINSSFVGVPTGFTPPIGYDPYSTYYNGRYGSNGWSTYNPGGWSTYGPNGWRNYNRYSGSRSGVQIID